MIQFRTLYPQPGDTLHTWSSMACDKPTPPRWNMNGAKWVFVGYTPLHDGAFKVYHFQAIEQPVYDEYSAEWLRYLEATS